MGAEHFFILAQASDDGSSMIMWVVLLAALALLPFMLAMITSFAKLVIVGGIVRQALGTQQVPPNTVITGLALILTVHIMWPVITQTWENYRTIDPNLADTEYLEAALGAAVPPLESFLRTHSDPGNIDLFESLRERDDAPDTLEGVSPGIQRLVDMITIVAPAFVLTELTEAFQIGFLLFVPFVVIDLVVANILMAMGMHMLSPTTISLPLKLLLFVLIDGWRLIVQGLVVGYA